MEKIKRLKKSLNEISVYDLNKYSMLELYYKLVEKVNEVITEFLELGVNVSDNILEQNKKLEQLLNQGVTTEVFNKINEMLLNGDFEKIINEVVFSELNSKLENLIIELKTIHNKTKYLTPEMFGAVGDGITDDLTAFQNMFEFMNTNADLISIGGSEQIKDFGEYKILFSGKYAVSNTLLIPSCYNLYIDGLYLTSTINFLGDTLLKSTGIFRNSIFNNCIIDGNWWKASCFLIESSSLNNRFNNCVFRRYKEYGLKAGDNKGHELIISNCKMNQYEWGDENEGRLPNTQGVGLYLGVNRFDNQITNSTFNYCRGSALKIEGGSNFFTNIHVYSPNILNSYGVEVIGSYNYFDNCFFDYTTVLLNGFNYIKNSFFMGERLNFIVLNETNENKWKYETSSIIGNTFKGNTDKITEPIKALNFSLNNSFINMYDNTFNNCEPFFSYTSQSANPTPFKTFKESLNDTGYQIVGNIKYMWGYANCNIPTTLDCSRILNVQISPATESLSNDFYVSGVTSNQFTPKGTGAVFYFAICVV